VEPIERCIDQVEITGIAYARAVTTEMALEAQRPVEKQSAIRRMVGSPNPVNGKPHSASSAEEVVETDPDYADHLRKQREAVFAKITCGAAYEAAKLRAKMAMLADHELAAT
jgi:hypothetical protein